MATHIKLRQLLESGKSVYQLKNKDIVYSDSFITHGCRHLKHLLNTLDGGKIALSLDNSAIDITYEFLNQLDPQTFDIHQSYKCIVNALPTDPNASYVGFGCGSSYPYIKTITFYKYYYDTCESVKTTISNFKSINNDILYKAHIYNNNDISDKVAHHFTIVSLSETPTYQIHAFVPKPSFPPSDCSSSSYIVTVSLKNTPPGKNPSMWKDIQYNTYTALNAMYDISVNKTDLCGNPITQKDFYPKWIKVNNLWYYYGGFGYFFNKLVPAKSTIIINIDVNVVLPFGITSTFFCESSDHPLNLDALLAPYTNNNIVYDPSFAPGHPTDKISWNLKSYFNTNGENLWSYFQARPIKQAKSITINGGVISGYILKTSPNPCDNNACDPYNYFTDLANSRADTNYSYRVRWSKPTTYAVWQNMTVVQFIRAVEYWIYGGLLELYSENITLNGLSVLDGWMRGISPVQLNAYNIYSNDQKLTNVSDGKTVINNCQFCLFNNCQVDGLDIMSNNVTYQNVYFQASDDVLKLSSSNITADNITIISGQCGGAINLGSYGTNDNSLNNIKITGIYVHGYYKKTSFWAPGVSDITDLKKKWPGAGIITAYNLGDAISKSDLKNSINISNLHVFNHTKLNINNQLVNNLKGNLVEPCNFLTGDYSNTTAKKLTISFSNIWYHYLDDKTLRIKLDIIDNRYLNSYMYIPDHASYQNLTFKGIYDNLPDPPIQPSSNLKHHEFGWAYWPWKSAESRPGLNGPSQYTLFQGYNGSVTGTPAPSNNIWHQMWLGPNPSTNNTILFKSGCQGGTCYKCLDGGEDLPAIPTLQIWDCNGSPQQQWIFNKASQTISPSNYPNLCIGVSGEDDTNGKPLKLMTCDSTLYTKWEGAGDYQWISSINSSKCMDLNAGDTTNGKQLQIWDCQ